MKFRSIAQLDPQELDAGFHWRTRGGEGFVRPSNMETRHVFFTWLMIWNHSCPEELQRPEGRRYHFGPFYTASYMLQAFRVMFNELKSRKDIPTTWKQTIEEVLASYAEWRGLSELNEIHQVEEKEFSHA